MKGDTSHKFKTSPRGFMQGATSSPVLFCTDMTNVYHRLGDGSNHKRRAYLLIINNFLDDFDRAKCFGKANSVHFKERRKSINEILEIAITIVIKPQ